MKQQYSPSFVLYRSSTFVLLPTGDSFPLLSKYTITFLSIPSFHSLHQLSQSTEWSHFRSLPFSKLDASAELTLSARQPSGDDFQRLRNVENANAQVKGSVSNLNYLLRSKQRYALYVHLRHDFVEGLHSEPKQRF